MENEEQSKSEMQPPPSSGVFNKFKSFMRRQPPKRRLVVVASVSLGVLVVGILAIQTLGPKAAEPDPVPEVVSNYVPPEPPKPTKEASKLTGAQVELELNKRPVTAVMIENSIDARPQAGLYDAGVVFEAIAEGGITRFLALFQEAQPGYIGPIRSARPYYVRWAAGFDAGYVHSGGSPEALALVRKLGLKDLDHGKYTGSFDRVTNRYAPHNVYTSMERLDSLRESLGYTSSDFSGFERITIDPDSPAEEAEEIAIKKNDATKIVFNISSSNYNTSYSYDAESNTYDRVMAGIPHKDDRSGKQINPSVVIALETTYGIHSNGIHGVYGIVGSGNVTVFQNGQAIKGKWSKASDTAELKFTTTAGKPLLLQPGQTWITAIHNNRYSYTE